MAGYKATPYARKVARQYHIDLAAVTPSGSHGEIKERDVIAAREGRRRRSKVSATPLAMHMAESMDIDLAEVRGTGVNGRVRKEDVLAAAGRAGGLLPGEHAEALTGMRRTIAKRMTEAANVPTVTVTTKVDVTEMLRRRKEHNDSHAHHYTVNDIVTAACAKALAKHRRMLCRFDGDRIIYKDSVNLGIAVSVDDGLVVPVIAGADKLSMDELSSTAHSLAARAREKRLSPDAFSGSSFTVSNMGMFGVEAFTPILNPPDSAILGVCAVSDACLVREGVALVRKVMRICLTFDHRVMDGAEAAKFNLTVREYLEHSEALF